MVVEVAGAPKEKAPEKNSLPMPIDVTDPNFEVRDEKVSFLHYKNKRSI